MEEKGSKEKGKIYIEMTTSYTEYPGRVSSIGGTPVKNIQQSRPCRILVVVAAVAVVVATREIYTSLIARTLIYISSSLDTPSSSALDTARIESRLEDLSKYSFKCRIIRTHVWYTIASREEYEEEEEEKEGEGGEIENN